MEAMTDKQMLVLESRKKLTVDGVSNIDSFDDDYLEISTNLGKMIIEGKDLKIEELRQENTKIVLTGDISGIFYKENRIKKGIFGSGRK